ncbi:hypothetical protein [Enterococcus timonensis]|uniref:hypothetical protein n=1 Tax=Enterococcus timonensis TaxID=1852364 RepID=UPI0008DA9A4E|nr:hypothetical protein [Enterococcus timonensis]
MTDKKKPTKEELEEKLAQADRKKAKLENLEDKNPEDIDALNKDFYVTPDQTQGPFPEDR